MSSALADTLRAAHEKVAHLTTVIQKQVEPGDKIPAVHVKEDDPNNLITLDNVKGKIIILGVAGAFTPPCSSQIPAYIGNYEKFKDKGVSEIFVVTVNDAFVVKAWKEKLAPQGTPVRFIADDQGTFTSKLGLTFDARPLLGSHRAKRFVLVAEDGVIKSVAVEDEVSNVTVTSADAVLAHL